MSRQTIGDKDAFPMPGYSGMTFRQWLIGQALAGAISAKADSPAMVAIECADTILEHLEQERTLPNGP